MPPGAEPRGARALGEALVHNQVLTYLDISENELRDEGISFITQHLRRNVSRVGRRPRVIIVSDSL